MYRKTTIVVFILMLFLMCSYTEAEASNYILKENVKIEMADGTHLMANLYLLDTINRHPTILIRNPYNKDYLSIFGEMIVKYGYNVVIQDVRGKYASEGIFTVFADEKKDGLATLDWIEQQPWSDGKIGIYGPSYLSYCGMILAPENHPALKTVVNSSGISDIYELMYFSGAFNQTMAIWMKRMGSGKVDYNGIFSMLPLRRMVDSIMEPHTATIMNHDTRDKFYQNMSINDYSEINIPILHSTGWNDFMYRNTLNAYNELTKTNPHQKIFIGPWTHNQQLNAETTKYGDEDFGENALFGLHKDLEISMKWFDYHIKGIDNGIMEEPRVRYFMMGKNEWRTSHQFPPDNMKEKKYYLYSEKAANSRSGDGMLTENRKELAGKDTYVYDPENPVPTVGGVNGHIMMELAGIKDQSVVEIREDILVYTSEKLNEDTEIAGEIKVLLYVSSDVIDTDFTAKLVEVRADGYCRIIEDGIAKTRFRNGFEKKEKMITGDIYEIEIIVGTTAISIPKGNRIRLEISSSNYPKFPRNHNTGIRETDAVKFKKAHQVVYHSSDYPSCLILPVLE